MKIGKKRTIIDTIETVNEYDVKTIFTFEKIIRTANGNEIKRTEEYFAYIQIGDSPKMLIFSYKQYKRATNEWNKIKEKTIQK